MTFELRLCRLTGQAVAGTGRHDGEQCEQRSLIRRRQGPNHCTGGGNGAERWRPEVTRTPSRLFSGSGREGERKGPG